MPNQQPGTNWPSVCSSPGPLDCSPVFWNTLNLQASTSHTGLNSNVTSSGQEGSSGVLAVFCFLAWVVVIGLCSEFIKLYT